MAAGLIVFVGAGVGVYGPGVFLAALNDRYGWSRGSISLATTVYYLAGGVFGIFIGRWVDRHGPRRLFIGSACCMAVALVLIGQVRQLWQLFPVYVLMAPGMTGLANIPITALVARWFVRKRAMALSVTMSGISLGGMVLTPLTVGLIDRWELGVATIVLAVLVLAVVIPMTLFVIRDDPAEMRLGPDGDPPLAQRAVHSPGAPAASVWTRATAIRTRAFWVLVVAFGFGLAAQQAFLLHQISYLKGEIGIGAAATVLSATAGASIIGRLAVGTVSDRLDKRWLAATCFAVQGLAVLLILRTTALPLIYLYTLAFGLTMGNSYIMVSLLTAECFGIAAFGAVYGLLNLFVMGGSAFGPFAAGALADASGGYLLPFTISGTTALMMAAVVLGARPPTPVPSAAFNAQR